MNIVFRCRNWGNYILLWYDVTAMMSSIQINHWGPFKRPSSYKASHQNQFPRPHDIQSSHLPNFQGVATSRQATNPISKTSQHSVKPLNQLPRHRNVQSSHVPTVEIRGFSRYTWHLLPPIKYLTFLSFFPYSRNCCFLSHAVP